MLDVLLVGAEELENLGTRYLAAVLRQHGYSVELAPFSTADDMDAVVRCLLHPHLHCGVHRPADCRQAGRGQDAPTDQRAPNSRPCLWCATRRCLIISER